MKRAEAIELGLSRYNTGKPCRRGHIAERITQSGNCVTCRIEDEDHDYSKHWREKHPDYSKCWRAKHPGYVAKKNKQWKEQNPEKRQKIKLKYDNTEKGKLVNCEGCARHRASKKNATPIWLTREDIIEIRQFYKESMNLTKKTGITYHVDHIIPLNGKNVSGLHVPWNLQVLSRDQNLKKSNKVDVL